MFKGFLKAWALVLLMVHPAFATTPVMTRLPEFLDAPYRGLCEEQGLVVGSGDFYQCVFDLLARDQQSLREELFTCDGVSPQPRAQTSDVDGLLEQLELEIYYSSFCDGIGFPSSHAGRSDCLGYFVDQSRANGSLVSQQCRVSEGHRVFLLKIRPEQETDWHALWLFDTYASCGFVAGLVSRNRPEVSCVSGER